MSFSHAGEIYFKHPDISLNEVPTCWDPRCFPLVSGCLHQKPRWVEVLECHDGQVELQCGVPGRQGIYKLLKNSHT